MFKNINRNDFQSGKGMKCEKRIKKSIPPQLPTHLPQNFYSDNHI